MAHHLLLRAVSLAQRAAMLPEAGKTAPKILREYVICSPREIWLFEDKRLVFVFDTGVNGECLRVRDRAGNDQHSPVMTRAEMFEALAELGYARARRVKCAAPARLVFEWTATSPGRSANPRPGPRPTQHPRESPAASASRR